MNIPCGPVIVPYLLESGGSAYNFGAATGAWTANNDAYFVPFEIWEPITIQFMYIWNVTPSGNIDLGIYSRDGTKLASTGSTALSGSNTTQGVALSLTIGPGKYYMAAACDTTGYTPAIVTTGLLEVTRARAGGCLKMASAFPLPATATFAAIASAYVPMIGLSRRSFV